MVPLSVPDFINKLHVGFRQHGGFLRSDICRAVQKKSGQWWTEK